MNVEDDDVDNNNNGPLDLPPFRSYNRFRSNSKGRFNHLQRLWLKKKIKKSLSRDSNLDLSTLMENLQHEGQRRHDGLDVVGQDVVVELHSQVKEELRSNELLSKNRELEKRLHGYNIKSYMGQAEYPIEVRVKNLTYNVPLVDSDEHIRTVFNSSFVYPVWQLLNRAWTGERRHRRRRGVGSKCVLANINLIFEPGKSYLLLGAPGSGKSSLLRAITGNLHASKRNAVSGTISYNGRTLDVSVETPSVVCLPNQFTSNFCFRTKESFTLRMRSAT
jgi:ABC-type multidrug transport system fused ATPase/permease subunit